MANSTNHKRKLSAEKLAEAASLREEGGLAVGKIAARLGVSEGALSWYFLSEGVEPPRNLPVLPQTAPGPSFMMRNGFPVRRFSPEEDRVIQQLASDGLKCGEIGRRLDPPRTPNAVRGRLLTLARHEARREAAAERDE